MDYEALASARAEISYLDGELTDARKLIDEFVLLLGETRALLGSMKTPAHADPKDSNVGIIRFGDAFELYMRIVEVLK